jgi:rfaE bifunctional protein kinase chain/domain
VVVDDLRLLQPTLDAIRGRRVLVVGDLYLDHYVFGLPSRVSREAPIMVLEETRREDRPGGGTAPALAVAALGGLVWQVGVIGDDTEGARLKSLLGARGVDVAGLVVDPDRPTTTKTRLVAEGPFNVFPQQVARVDRQDRTPISPEIAARLTRFITEIAPTVDAVLLSDYRSGVIVPEVIDATRRASRLATVDSQGALADFAGLGLVKCNQGEAEAYLGQSLGDPDSRRSCLIELRQKLDCTRLVVTLGPEGAALVEETSAYAEVPPIVRRQVFDVTGAGDTVIAVMTAALAAGADSLSALRLSQVAAGIVIGKWGNAQATAEEIAAALDEG